MPLFDVWCGAVEIGGLGRTLWRPGTYSCRVEALSAKESYVDFTFSDGGTYYLVLDCKDPCAGPEDVRPSTFRHDRSGSRGNVEPMDADSAVWHYRGSDQG